MYRVKASSSSGVGFLGLLTILFIGLKLAGYIGWSWWIVLGPITIPLGLILIGGLLYLIYNHFSK